MVTYSIYYIFSTSNYGKTVVCNTRHRLGNVALSLCAYIRRFVLFVHTKLQDD